MKIILALALLIFIAKANPFEDARVEEHEKLLEREGSGCQNGGWSCCSSSNQCSIGEGDCDKDSECSGNLVCGTDNCGSNFPTGTDGNGVFHQQDCCTQAPQGSGCNNGGWSCCSSSNQCNIGEGDCDNDSECSGNLVCGTDNCGSNFPTGGTDGNGVFHQQDCCTEAPQGDTCAKIPSWMKSDLANRIINGKTAPSPIPWQVHLRQGSPTDFTRVCGGTIIDAKTILTAAHCYANKDLNSANFFVTAGIVDRINGAGQNAFVEKIILHESYIQKNPISPSNDIAILKLKTPLAFNDKVQQACLPDASFVPTGKAVASGWGWTRPDAAQTLIGDDRFPKDLQWVAMPVVTNDKCDQAPFKWDAGRITANMICAGDADGGEDTCKGDSGGPLVIPKSSTDDTAVVIGITSFGDLLCGKQGFPGVYTYVTRYLNWIKPKMEN